jgi:hypothetical protein
MSHFVDPSWCARLHAARTSAARPEVPAAPVDSVPSAAPEEPAHGRSDSVPVPEVRAPLFVRREIPSVHECELCGTVMYEHNCKIVCPNCGYKRDCSDP